MPTTSTELPLGRRFCGPPGMAHGGFACGAIAALVGGAAEVTLRRPLPLGRPLAVHQDGAGVLLVEDGDALLAQARPAAAEAARLPADTSMLLGRMTASLAAPPRAGDRCRVLAWPGERDGRKLAASSALLGPGGRVLAAARAVWVTMPSRSAPAAGAAS